MIVETLSAVELVSRFPVDDDELSALHARAFGGDVQMAPWRGRDRIIRVTNAN